MKNNASVFRFPLLNALFLSPDGKIRLFRDNQVDPMTEASYDTSLNLNYVSFGASNVEPTKVRFFYNCLL